jgi:hypothetical protein
MRLIKKSRIVAVAFYVDFLLAAALPKQKPPFSIADNSEGDCIAAA